jgi:hypothetical protein
VEYWIARSGRAMTTSVAHLETIIASQWDTRIVEDQRL